MQCSVIEWARNIARLERANSSEFDPETPNPVINLLPEQHYNELLINLKSATPKK